MNIKNPKVSVIMPVYNGEKYLKKAVDSILEQTFRNFELLVISDGSTDGSKKIIDSYNDNRIRFIDNTKNKGLIFTLNRGLKEAGGEYIARMDQDDISLPDRFQKQYDFLENNPNVTLIGGWAKVIDKNGQQIRNKKLPLTYDEIKFNLLFRNPLIHSTIFFRRDAVNDLGGYNKEYQHAEDFELYSRLVKNNLKILNLPEFLIKFRIHNSSIGQTPKTKSIQNETVTRIIFENIRNYISVSQENFKLFYNKKKIIKIKYLLKVLILHRNIFRSYIKKELLNEDQIKKILPFYKMKRKEFFKQYVKNKLNL